MSHSDLELVRHINDECAFILKTTSAKNFDQFYNDIILRKAIERSLEIIGEACKKIADEFKTGFPEVAWNEMAATRNIIIHNYTGVDYAIVWQIIQDEIPELEFQMKNILKEHEKEDR